MKPSETSVRRSGWRSLAVVGPDRTSRWRGERPLRPAARSAFAAVVALSSALGGTPVRGEEKPADLASLLWTQGVSTLAGERVRIDAAEAPASVIHFWASWCAPCKKELPLLDALAAEIGPAGVRFVAVSIDNDPRNAERFVRRHGIALPVFLDSEKGLAERLALASVPSTFVLDRGGRVTFATRGSSEEEVARLRSHLQGLVRASRAGAEAGPDRSGDAAAVRPGEPDRSQRSAR